MESLAKINEAIQGLGFSESTIDVLIFLLTIFLSFTVWILKGPIFLMLSRAFKINNPQVRRRVGIFLRDKKFVGAYSKKFSRYIKISEDEAISQYLRDWGGIILLGRGGIGKSQAACEHIRKFCRAELCKIRPRIWYVVTPDRQNLQSELQKTRIPKRVILFFDDINEYLSSGEVAKFFDYVDHYRQATEEVKLVCTCRSTKPEVDSLDDVMKLFSRLYAIRLPDWTEEQRQELASHTGVNVSEWDGTPLSAKMPSSEMLQRYLRLDDGAKIILQTLKHLSSLGLSFISVEFLESVFDKISPNKTAEALKFVNGMGFFKKCDLEIEVYKPYLDFVENPPSRIRELVKEALIDLPDGRLFYRVIASLVNFKELNAAWDLLKEQMDKSGERSTSYYWIGVIERRRSRWRQALRAFENAAKLDPDHPANWRQLISLYEKLGENELAIEAKTKVARTNRMQSPSGQMAFAIQEMKEGNDEYALELITKALESDANLQKGWGLKGQMLLHLRRNQEAETALEEAESRDPDAFVYFGLAQAQRNQKKWREALKNAKKAINIEPEIPQAWSLRGQCEKEVGILDAAQNSYREAIRLGAGVPAHFGQGLIYRQLGDVEGMIAEFEVVVRLEPRNALAWSYLGDGYAKMKQAQEAMSAYEKSVKLKQSDPSFELSYANGLGMLGRRIDAVEKLKALVKTHPDFKPASNSLAYWESKIV